MKVTKQSIIELKFVTKPNTFVVKGFWQKEHQRVKRRLFKPTEIITDISEIKVWLNRSSNCVPRWTWEGDKVTEFATFDEAVKSADLLNKGNVVKETPIVLD